MRSRGASTYPDGRVSPHGKKECLMQKTTKKAAADYMTEPHDPRDSISSQASARSPSSRATAEPPPETMAKAVIRFRNSPFSREFCIYVYICMCIYIGIRMHVRTCVYVCVCIFVHRL